MPTRPARHRLQAGKPKVVLLGDAIVDYHVYDNRAEDSDQWLAWTSPLSRDDWHYSEGYDIRTCLGGSAAIHAMLATNNIAVAGNAFPINAALRNRKERGSIFVLKRRSNAGKAKEDRTRKYLTSTATAKGPWGNTVVEERGETWRAAASFLSKSGLPYVKPFDTQLRYDKQAVKVVCFWDVGRGYFRRRTDSGWNDQQEALFTQYVQLCRGTVRPSILIRTDDLDQFTRFLELLAGQRGEPPMVVIVCGQEKIDDGNLRGSGTWSGVWRQTYDHLNKPERRVFHEGDREWRLNIVIPVSEDGAIWIGPDCWPIDQTDRRDEYLREDKRPIGRLFMVPGMQPGLSEFEEHSRIIGVHALLAYSVLEHLTQARTVSRLDPAIKEGLMRCRRLRSHGYCTPQELFPIADFDDTFFIHYPCEIWKRDRRGSTDTLLDVRDKSTKQNAGPCEVRCQVDFPRHSTVHDPESFRIFQTMEKKISGEFVGSPANCRCVVGDIERGDDALKRLELKKREDGRVTIKGRPRLMDTFATEEIETFRLRQRISMQFGNFAMANPREAASMLDLAHRVKQHVLGNRYNPPEKGSVFNFALFGTPGSGKSFLAREIARLIDPKGTIFNVDEFNLSQFTEPQQLTRALGLIASKGVGGKIPLVLWDEFDSVFNSQRGGWLARFLMPMQDAYFFDGSQRWPIGTAVFVFIGGTFPTAKDFRAWACATTGPDGAPPDSVLLKARDFHSRLYVALDMPSIIELDDEVNARTGVRCQMFRTSWTNSYTKLARAVLLREYFRNNSRVGKKVFLKQIEDDLCRFLLAIPLRHGARSLQRIVEACLVSKPTRVSMLHLPPKHLLSEHIETENVRLENSRITGVTIEAMLEACRNSAPSR